MRMADADMIPVSFGDMADTIARYDKELHEMVDKDQSKAKETMLKSRRASLKRRPILKSRFPRQNVKTFLRS